MGLEIRSSEAPIGVHYSRHFWSGMGYRNFQEVGLGIQYGKILSKVLIGEYESINYLQLDLRLQHNHRLKLNKLLYFSMNLGYSPLIPLEKGSTSLYDDFVNAGYVNIGLNGFIRRFRAGLYLGANMREAKQDLFYEIHTYARFAPQVSLNFSFSFGKKYD